MKKLIFGTISCAFLFVSCGGNETATEDAKCNAQDLMSATVCICDLYSQLDNNSAELSDEDYDALLNNIDAFNAEIDKAIDGGIYSNDDLLKEADKLKCGL